MLIMVVVIFLMNIITIVLGDGKTRKLHLGLSQSICYGSYLRKVKLKQNSLYLTIDQVNIE